MPDLVRTARSWGSSLGASEFPSEATQATPLEGTWLHLTGYPSQHWNSLQTQLLNCGHGWAASASSKGLFDMQTLNPHPTPAELESASYQHPQGLQVRVGV